MDSAVIVSKDSDNINGFKTVANIALEQSAGIISEYFGDLIEVATPYVTQMNKSELALIIAKIRSNDKSIFITQRYVGGGIHGEALVHLSGEDILTFGCQLGLKPTDYHQNEIISDIANIMVSSFLLSLSKQIKIPFSVRHPIILEDYMGMSNAGCNAMRYLTVDYECKAVSLDFKCEMLFMMDANSIYIVNNMDVLN